MHAYYLLFCDGIKETKCKNKTVGKLRRWTKKSPEFCQGLW